MDLWIVLVIILVAVIVWRGPKTLPQLGRAFGRGVKEAREEAAKAQTEIQARTTTDPEDRVATAPAPVATPPPPAAAAPPPAAAATAPPPPVAAPPPPAANPPEPTTPPPPTDRTPPSAV
jgi:Sec-independent protein translocase protein TatA